MEPLLVLRSGDEKHLSSPAMERAQATLKNSRLTADWIMSTAGQKGLLPLQHIVLQCWLGNCSLDTHCMPYCTVVYASSRPPSRSAGS